MAGRDLAYFYENIDQLISDYNGKFVAIKNASILGVYSSYTEAYEKTIVSEDEESFIVRQCTIDSTSQNALGGGGNSGSGIELGDIETKGGKPR